MGALHVPESKKNAKSEGAVIVFEDEASFRQQRGRGLIQNKSDLLDTDLLPIRTAEEIPPAVCEAAPTGCPVVICFASFIGSSNVLELSTNRKSAPFPAR